MVEYNIQTDHIHIVMIIPPKYKVSEVVSRIKAQAASRLRKKVSWLSKVYRKENIVWSPGYSTNIDFIFIFIKKNGICEYPVKRDMSMSKKTINRRLVWILDDEFISYEIEREKLQKYGYELVISNNESFKKDYSKFASIAQGILLAVSFSLKSKDIKGLKNCKIISVIGGGYNNLNLGLATENGIAVTYVPDYCLEEVSDHTLSLILALNRRLPECQTMTTKGTWKALNIGPIKRLKGQILGIVGFGRIAQSVAQKAICLGLKIIAFDPYKSALMMKQMNVEKVSLNKLVTISNFITLHLPLTDETFHLFNYNLFKKMKNTPYLINACRGGVVDEFALIKALEGGVIAGAGLDVLNQEPPNPQNPLLHMSNVIVTPHSAYISQEALSEVRIRAVQAIIDALEGKIPKDVINPEVFC